MGQPRGVAALFLLFGCGWWCALAGCERKTASRPAAPAGAVTVASLSPAATDLIRGMGAADQLVAVSNFDPTDLRLPRVGDYQTTDWEALAAAKPRVTIIQMDPGRLAPGFRDRAERLGTRLLNVRLNSMEDVIGGAGTIGREIGAEAQGHELAARMKAKLDAVRARAAGKAPVRTLLTMDERGERLIGVGEFLNDALTIAGGTNAAASLGAPYPTADAEMLPTLRPEAVIVLKPNGSADALAKARRFWSTIDAPAGKAGRVYLIANADVLMPGAHVADVAEAMERCLHGGGDLAAGDGRP